MVGGQADLERPTSVNAVSQRHAPIEHTAGEVPDLLGEGVTGRDGDLAEAAGAATKARSRALP